MNRCCNGIYFVNPFVAVERRKKSRKRWTTKPNKSMHNKSEEWTRENFDIIKNGSALFIVPIFLRLLEIMHQTIWTVNDDRRGLCHDIGCSCAIILSCYRAIHDVWCMVKGNDECDIKRWVRVNGEMNWIRNTRNVRNHPEWCNIITSHHIFICGNGPIRMELLEKDKCVSTSILQVWFVFVAIPKWNKIICRQWQRRRLLLSHISTHFHCQKHSTK